MANVFKSEKGREQVLKSYNHLLKLWDTDIEEVDLKTKYGLTHCIIAGDKLKPPLLMFHGVGDNSAVMWLLNMKELSRHFYCIAVDTIGGPGKSAPNENYNRKSFNQVDWINEIVEQLKISNFNIIGVSNGAYMALNYTTREKHRVNKVVCLEGGIVINPIKSMIGTLLLLFPEILIPTRSNQIKAMKKLLSPNSNLFEMHPEVIEHLLLVTKSHNNKAMLGHKLEKYDKERAIAVREKLYFLLGDHMIDTRKERKEYINILDDGGFNYKIISNSGHAINHEQPAIVHNEIVHFLLG